MKLLLNSLYTSKIDKIVIRGQNIAIEGFNKNIIFSFFQVFLKIIMDHIPIDKQKIFCPINNILIKYIFSYLNSFTQEKNNQIHKKQEELYKSVDIKISEQREKINQKEKEIRDNKIKALKEENKRIQDENTRRVNFMIHTGHEIKRPLTILNDALNSLNLEIGNRLYKSIPVIDSQIQLLNRMITHIFDYEKILQGKIVYDHINIIDISKMTKEKVKSYIPVAECDGLQIHSDIKDNLSVKIHPQAYNSIFDNLMENALKYNKKSGSVTVTIKDKDNFVYLTVTDTGIGIKEKDRENIFKPFYQSIHREKQYQGIGMGLALIKKIIELVPGNISFESEEGKGSVFTVTFKKENIDAQQRERLNTQVRLTRPMYRKRAILKNVVQHDIKKRTVLFYR